MKNILSLINSIKFIIESLNIKNKLRIIEWTIKLWLLTIVVPLTSTIVATFFAIVGLMDFSNLPNFLYHDWVGFYITGYILGLIAWKIHLGILFLCFIFSASTNYEN